MAKHKKTALSKNKMRFKALKLTPSKEKELFAVINSDASTVKDKDDATRTLCESILPLVHSLAFYYVTLCPYMDINDLIGEGTQGALKAIKHFDPQKEVRLVSYARKDITGSITDACNRFSSAFRPSKSRRRRIKQLQNESKNFELEHGRKATDQELHQITGFSNKYIQDNRNGVITVRSLDEKINSRNSTTILEKYENDECGCDFREEIYRKEIMRFLYDSLDGKDPQTLKDMGEKLHLSIETVRRIVTTGLVQLQIMLCNPNTVA